MNDEERALLNTMANTLEFLLRDNQLRIGGSQSERGQEYEDIKRKLLKARQATQKVTP